MKPICYKIVSVGVDADQVLTEFINNTLRRLNEDEAPVQNDMETHWELDSQFVVRDSISFVFALWTGRY